ncbi:MULTISPECIES: glycosyltransferase [Paenibacillus]|uniref:glycosyltransferase n=1 Tax=Paenibacillus TaxID=44249 RepID=UPI00211AFA3F|nr:MULTISPECIES: glycosyltransferase [Paenibacillus]
MVYDSAHERTGEHATQLGYLLAQKGHKIHMISLGHPLQSYPAPHNLFYHEAKVNNYYVFGSPPYELALSGKIIQVSRDLQLDLIHVHFAAPHVISAYLAKQIIGVNFHVVTTLKAEDIDILATSGINKDLIRLALTASDVLTAESNHLISETTQLLQIPCDNIHLIPGFVHLPVSFFNERILEKYEDIYYRILDRTGP